MDLVMNSSGNLARARIRREGSGVSWGRVPLVAPMEDAPWKMYLPRFRKSQTCFSSEAKLDIGAKPCQVSFRMPGKCTWLGFGNRFRRSLLLQRRTVEHSQKGAESGAFCKRFGPLFPAKTPPRNPEPAFGSRTGHGPDPFPERMGSGIGNTPETLPKNPPEPALEPERPNLIFQPFSVLAREKLLCPKP